MRQTLSLLLLLFLVPLTAFGEQPTSDDPPTSVELVFGVYKSDKATEMYRQFSPVIEALSDSLSASLKTDVDIQLRIFRTYDEGLQALVEGEVDFVRFGPASYILSKAQNEAIRLLAMEEKKGKTRSDGLIIARKDSGLKSLADLKGKSFAFGDQNSTIGRFLSQERLIDAGVRAADLSNFRFLGRHDKVVRAVQVGDFDAGAVKISTFQKLNQDGSLVVLDTFDNVTKPWIASSKLDAGVFEELRDALIGLNDPQVLATFKVSRFIATSDGEYDFVRRGMKRAKAFDAKD